MNMNWLWACAINGNTTKCNYSWDLKWIAKKIVSEKISSASNSQWTSEERQTREMEKWTANVRKSLLLLSSFRKVYTYKFTSIYINANSLKYASQILNSSYWNNEWIVHTHTAYRGNKRVCMGLAWIKKQREKKGKVQQRHLNVCVTQSVHAHK